MRKQFARLVLWLCLLGGASVYAQSGMTDSQIIEYAKQAYLEGKDQQTIAMELLAKGATQEQLLRLKSTYSGALDSSVSSDTETEVASKSNSDEKVSRVRKESNTSEQSQATGTQDASRWSDEMKKSMEKRRGLMTEPAGENDVFGRNIFNIEKLTFQPNLNMATPENYRLGPGDEVIVDVWGASQTTLKLAVSPDGYVNIPIWGPFF